MDFWNCYELTGLYPQLVSIIFSTCCTLISKPRFSLKMKPIDRCTVKFSPWNRMLLVLSWFRSGYSLRELARQWKISTMFCYRELRHLIPILLEKLRIIRLFGDEFLKLFPRPIGEFMVQWTALATAEIEYTQGKASTIEEINTFTLYPLR